MESVSTDIENIKYLTPSFDNDEKLKQFFKQSLDGETGHYLIIPSMSFDQELLEGIEGIGHYELRSLWEILRVKKKNTYVTFVTSNQISKTFLKHFIDVFSLTKEELSRIFFVICPRINGQLSLTKNILESPGVLFEIKKSFRSNNIVMESFVCTEDEKKLGKSLGIPVWYGHPQMNYFHTKSGNRYLVEGIAPMPQGESNLFSKEAVIRALIKLKNNNISNKYFMLKLNFGVSGQGNMKLSLSKSNWEKLNMKEKKIIAERSLLEGNCFNLKLNHEEFLQRIVSEGAVVEEFVQGKIVDSPSAQVFVSPMGVDLISTHRQILDDDGQKFVGGEFPCLEEDKEVISAIALKIGNSLKEKKVFGVTSIDFLIVNDGGKRECFVIELNIRKGGTTHPFMISNIALKSRQYYNNGLLKGDDNNTYIYRSNDNFYPNRSLFKCEKSLLSEVQKSGILFCSKNKKGVIFHLLNSYEEIGKVGYTVIGKDIHEINTLEGSLKRALTSPGSRKLSIVARNTLH